MGVQHTSAAPHMQLWRRIGQPALQQGSPSGLESLMPPFAQQASQQLLQTHLTATASCTLCHRPSNTLRGDEGGAVASLRRGATPRTLPPAQRRPPQTLRSLPQAQAATRSPWARRPKSPAPSSRLDGWALAAAGLRTWVHGAHTVDHMGDAMLCQQLPAFGHILAADVQPVRHPAARLLKLRKLGSLDHRLAGGVLAGASRDLEEGQQPCCWEAAEAAAAGLAADGHHAHAGGSVGGA